MNSRCPYHENNECMIVQGNILNCCDSSHTTRCKSKTIYNLVDKLEKTKKYIKKNKITKNKYDNLRKRYLKVIKKNEDIVNQNIVFQRQIKELHEERNDNSNNEKTDDDQFINSLFI